MSYINSIVFEILQVVLAEGVVTHLLEYWFMHFFLQYNLLNYQVCEIGFTMWRPYTMTNAKMCFVFNKIYLQTLHMFICN